MTFAQEFQRWHGDSPASTPAPASPLYVDSAHPIDEGRRVPVPRSEHAALISLCQLQEESLAELKHLVARASAGESRSSASVKTSARGVDLEVKSYADGLLQDAITDAIDGYARGQRELAALQASQWVSTLETLERVREGVGK